MARVSTILLHFVFALVLTAQNRSAVLIAQSEDKLYFLDESLRTLSLLPLKMEEVVAFSSNVPRSATALVRGRCGSPPDGDLYLGKGLGKPRKLTWTQRFNQGPWEEDEVEVYGDPALSPSGKFLAFVARPCSFKRQYDLVEAAGVVVVLDRERSGLRVLTGTLSSDKAPLGYANTPLWSPDESLILVNFETGFSVMRAPKGSVLLEYPTENRSEEWSNALGWIGANCIVYVAGKGSSEAFQNRLKVLNIKKRSSELLDNVSEGGDANLREVLSFQWPYAINRTDGKLGLVKLGSNGFAFRPLTGVKKAALLSRESTDVPKFCQP